MEFIGTTLSLYHGAYEVNQRERARLLNQNNPENFDLLLDKTKGFEITLVVIWLSVANQPQGTALRRRWDRRVVDGSLANKILSQVPGKHVYRFWESLSLDEKWAFGLGLIYQSEQIIHVEQPHWVTWFYACWRWH